MRRYVIVIEKAASNLSAYAPDVPGCVATGVTRQRTIANMRSALEMHIQGLRKDGQPIPEPTTIAEYVEIVS
jgi:predicted RNase H-like HicB family nuclease